MALFNKLQVELGALESQKNKSDKKYNENMIKMELDLFRQKREINYQYDLKLLERRFELEKDLVLYKHELNNK